MEEQRLRIRVWNALSRIECDSKTLFWLDEKLAVESPGAYWARKYRPGWDGFWHPLSVARRTFPTGLVTRVRDLLPLAEIIDERKRPPTIAMNPRILRGIILSDHQIESVASVLDPNRLIPGCGIIATSVGSGKTETGIAIACHVGGLCVWIVHRKDLLHQTADRIRYRAGEMAALIGDGHWDDVKDRKFLVVMPQTALQDLAGFAEMVKNASVLIADECHRTGAGQLFYRVAQSVPAYFRVGLTGTPVTGDPVRDMRLEAATGPVLVRYRAKDIAAIGWIVPATVHYHRVENDPSQEHRDYQEARRVLIEENSSRNAMIVDLAIRAAEEGKRCLVICDTIRHARIIAEILAGERVRSRLLTGKHSSTLRAQAKKDLRTGALEVMISTSLPGEELIFVRNRSTGRKSLVRIGEFCEKIFKEGEWDVWTRLSRQKEGWARVTAVHRHRRQNRVVSVRVAGSGARVLVTENHSLIDEDLNCFAPEIGKKPCTLENTPTRSCAKKSFRSGHEREGEAAFDEILPAELLRTKIGIGGPAQDQKIPDFIWDAPPHVRKAFLYGCFLSNSHFSRDGKYIVFTTVSRTLAVGIFYLLKSLGCNQIHVDERPPHRNRRRCYKIFVYDPIAFRRKRKERLERRIDRIEPWDRQDEYVYDISVEGAERFYAGFGILAHNTIFDEGIDIPELEVVIIAAGGKSAVRFIQRCGRALRRSPGKKKAIIHDFFDTGSAYLLRHSLARMRACKNEGFEIAGAPEALLKPTPPRKTP